MASHSRSQRQRIPLLAVLDEEEEPDFINTPPHDFVCPVTLQVLRQPHQTLCCGNHLSKQVAERLSRDRKPCPICKAPNLLTIRDKFHERKSLSLRVQCPHRERGCPWTGELGRIEWHLSTESVEGDCQYVEVTCLCGAKVQRRALSEHKLKLCPKRLFRCEFCGYEGTYDEVTAKHLLVCEKYPLSCPNGCGEEGLERQGVSMHLKESCPLQVIQCEFSHAGCKTQVRRSDLSHHMETNRDFHISILSSTLKQQAELIKRQEKQIENFERHCELLPKLEQHVEFLMQKVMGTSNLFPPVDLVMKDFTRHQTDGIVWFSPPFYTHPGGYKMCLSVDVCGIDGEGTDIAVFLHLMQGEFDDRLRWPFRGMVTVMLLDQQSDDDRNKSHCPRHHHERSLIEFDMQVPSVCVSKVEGKERNPGFGLPCFITTRELSGRDSNYLKNDCLQFRITEALLHKTMDPDFQQQ